MSTIIRIAVFVGCLTYTSALSANVDRPNILFILADDVGREVLGCYGGESYQTPHLDALAENGMRFEHCYSMAVCHPTRVCVLTGRYPATLKNPRWGTFPKHEESNTFASLLRDAGYATAVAGKWQLSLLKDDLQQPARMGFDRWSVFGWHEGPRYHEPLIYENGPLRTDTDGKYGPDLYVQFLIDFMEQQKGTPFLAYFPMALCHDVTDDIGKAVPYGPDGHWLTYEEMANDMDRQIGKLVSALDRLQLRENTLIIYTTDNGTAGASYLRFEDGKYVRPQVFSKINGRMVQGGKGKLNDWGTRVPLIVNWPGHIAGGQLVSDLVDFSDFLPTFADLAGTTPPADIPLNGTSFASRLKGDAPSPRKWAYAEHKGRRFLRTRTHKLYASGPFFDMVADPEEQTPLDPNDTKKVQHIRSQLQSAMDSLPVPK